MERFRLGISKGFLIVWTVKLWSKCMASLWTIHHEMFLKSDQICVRRDTNVDDTIFPCPSFWSPLYSCDPMKPQTTENWLALRSQSLEPYKTVHLCSTVLK